MTQFYYRFLGTAALQVLPNEPKIIRELNSNLILTCSGAPDAEWVGPDGFPISAESRDESEVYVQKIGERLRLRINDLEPATTGDYTCRQSLKIIHIFIQKKKIRNSY